MRTCLLLGLAMVTPVAAQNGVPPAAQTIPAETAITRTLDHTTFSHLATPFYVHLQVSGPTPDYTGSLDLAFASPTKYRLVLASPSFRQVRIRNGKLVSEQNTGDYLPNWLETFATFLTEPEALFSTFSGQTGLVAIGEHLSSCLRRDDRPNGITDQMTWGSLCFSGPEPHLQSVQTFNRFLELTDYQPFVGSELPRTLTTNVLDYKPVTGHVTILEPVSAEGELFTIDTPTLPADLIQTTFISTEKAQAIYESSPPITWPTVHEGRTDGYMIVYARTDRTGQVRESAKHNSDNPGLEQFGMEQALLFKFKPLVVDGIPQQMEIPIVLHFTSKVADPLPILNDAQMRAQISGCKLPVAKTGQPPFRIRVSVDEHGVLTGETFLDANNPSAPHQSSQPYPSLHTCKFAPYRVNGFATYYHGDLSLP